jgi:hypothetical protein
LLIPDRRGNNRIDSIKNVVEDPRVALIFLVPGANETYRVNGRARVSVDPVLKQRFAGVPTLGDFAAARTPGTNSSVYDADYARRMPSELY